MYQRLSIVTPDVDYTLSIDPIGELQEKRFKKQRITECDDNSEEIISDSSDLFYEVIIPWELLLADDAATIMECFFGYSNGIRYTFKWLHPYDGYTYIVKFKTEISREVNSPIWYKFNPVVLLVLGIPSDSVSFVDEEDDLEFIDSSGTSFIDT